MIYRPGVVMLWRACGLFLSPVVVVIKTPEESCRNALASVRSISVDNGHINTDDGEYES